MNPVSLRALFEFSGAMVEHAAAEQAKGAAAPTSPSLAGFVAESAAQHLNDALEADVLQLLADGWIKFKEVRDCANPKKHPADEVVPVKVFDAELTSTHSPLLRTTVGGVSMPELRFTLELVAKFPAIELLVKNARIRAVRPGRASAVVRLKYGKAQLAERSTPDWTLPLEWPLGKNGIAIAPRQT